MTTPGSEPRARRPRAAIAVAGGSAAAGEAIDATRVTLDATLLAQLDDICEVTTDPAACAEAGRDWWPQAMAWATRGQVPARAGAVARPSDPAAVARLLALCQRERVPVTPAAGRSGVNGGCVPVHGGVVIDLCGLSGVRGVDERSLVVDVGAGTFGDDLDATLRRDHGLTTGHWPQSVALSTVGGWLSCRGAGQASTRYGKIEDIVVGLDVALPDGTELRTGGAPRAAVGPDLTQLFVGAEGTLGIITGARLRVHPVPSVQARAAYRFAHFAAGLDAMRRILRRGATPAVLRLYDPVEADRSYRTGDAALLLVADEGDEGLVGATMAAVAAAVDEGASDAVRADEALVGQWFAHRNDVSALESLISKGYAVDTMEVSAPWSALPQVYSATLAALRAVPGTRSASAHQSHSYLDGGCLYFSFAARVAPEDRDPYYRAAWDAGQRAALAAGAALSHHHGVGLNRARFAPEALGAGLGVLAAIKAALDPAGICNPGKLGLDSPWGVVGYPKDTGPDA